MNKEMIDELLAVKKKSDASISKKDEFVRLCKEAFYELGYCPETEKIFYEGFSFCGSLPLAEIIMEMDENIQIDFYKKIISGELFIENDKGITFKVAVSLLGMFLKNSYNNYYIEVDLIKKMFIYEKNKEGNQWGELPKIVEKHFIKLITQTSHLNKCLCTLKIQ